MITRKLLSLPTSRPLLPHLCLRCLHAHLRRPPTPAPIPFVPDHTTFLQLIGRSLSKHASKFSSWEEMFKLSSSQLRERGIEPARDRRYLLRWREKYRKGEFGIGGDMRFVEDGVAVMRVVEVPQLPEADGQGRGTEAEAETGTETETEKKTKRADGATTDHDGLAKTRTARLIINVPAGATGPQAALQPGQSTYDLRKVQGMRLANRHMIQGPYVQPVKGTNGSVATLKVQEGLWEHRRGHKVDGGERRKKEVRFKRGVEERRKARE